MRSRSRIIAAAVLTVVLVISSVSAVFGGSLRVIYKDHAEKFIFKPGTEYSVTDLFTRYKGVMPGDSITDTIRVKNGSKWKVKIYLRALGGEGGPEADEERSTDFLSQLDLTVSAASDRLFDAPADRKDGLSEFVCLGTFAQGADMELNIMLNVPADLGNEYMDRIGYLRWQFAVVEIKDEDSGIVPTGDDTDPALAGSMLVLLAVSAAGIIAVFRKRFMK